MNKTDTTAAASTAAFRIPSPTSASESQAATPSAPAANRRTLSNAERDELDELQHRCELANVKIPQQIEMLVQACIATKINTTAQIVGVLSGMGYYNRQVGALIHAGLRSWLRKGADGTLSLRESEKSGAS
jgi:hypothetical protein